MTDAELAAARLIELLDTCRENTALRDEVMYLRAERAAVVAWLREQAEAAEWALTAAGYEHAADAIERGEHRRGEGG